MFAFLQTFEPMLAQIALALCICVSPLMAQAAQPPLRIGRITIQAAPLFNAAEASHGTFYRVANLLNVQTRVELLRRFILFKEGDAYDPVKLGETERNLRLFDFLESATVTAGAPHDGVVDVAIVTQDGWTTIPNGDFSNDGGVSIYDIDLKQKDLFGSGSELNLRIEKGVERRAKTIEFIHPAVLGPYWNLDTLYSKNSDGNEEKFFLERPLFSYSTPWAMSFLFDHDLQNARYFREGSVAARFRQQHRQAAFSRTRVLYADQNGSTGITAGIDLLDDSFSHLPDRLSDVIPDARHFAFITGGYRSTGFRFVKLDYVDRDLQKQDFSLGPLTSIDLGFSPRLSASRPAAWRLRFNESVGLAFTPRSFVIAQLNASSRAPRNRNTIVSIDLRNVVRFDTKYPQAFVARLRLDVGAQLDRDMQFFADGQNGLRAYPDFAFEGSRRFVVNAEQRIFLGREILQLFGPSIAFFADSGEAVDRNVRLSGMKSDVGVGLRIGIARYDSALLRFDLAYALNSSPLNRRGRVFSISTTHAF